MRTEHSRDREYHMVLDILTSTVKIHLLQTAQHYDDPNQYHHLSFPEWQNIGRAFRQPSTDPFSTWGHLYGDHSLADVISQCFCQDIFLLLSMTGQLDCYGGVSL